MKSVEGRWAEDLTPVQSPEIPEDGSFLSWGCGEFGQHCHQRSGDVRLEDGLVKMFSGNHGNMVKYMACGASHTIVVTHSNAVYTWGNGNSGQLGCGEKENHLDPVCIQLYALQPKNPKIRGVACGVRHTFVWLENGHMFSFGNNFFAQLGYDSRIKNYRDNQLKPHLLRSLTYKSVKQVTCGEKHSLFLFQDGVLAAVGNNTYGQIGSGDREEASAPRFQTELEPIRFIACGANHNIVIAVSGTVYVWGFGKPCGSKHHDILSPQFKVMRHRNIVAVAGGHTHSLALSGSGNVYSWGSGHEGQLGHGPKLRFSSSSRLVGCPELRGCVAQIACGEAFSAAVTADGLLYMWGKNSHVLCPEKPTNLKLYEPICLNRTGTRVSQVQCGAWHAVAVSGIPDWTKTDNASDTEADLPQQQHQQRQPASHGCSHSTHKVMSWPDAGYEADGLDDSHGSSEETELDVPLPIGMQREKTTITLAEFYAPSPEASHLTGIDLSPDHMEDSSPRSDTTRATRRQPKTSRRETTNRSHITVEVPQHCETEVKADVSHTPRISPQSSLVSQLPSPVVNRNVESKSSSPENSAHFLPDKSDQFQMSQMLFSKTSRNVHSFKPPSTLEQIPFKQRNDIRHGGLFRAKTQYLDTLRSTPVQKVTAYNFLLPRQESTLVSGRTLNFVPVETMKAKSSFRTDNKFHAGISHRLKSSRHQQRNTTNVHRSVRPFRPRVPVMLHSLAAKKQQYPVQQFETEVSPSVILPGKRSVPRTLTMPRTVTCLMPGPEDGDGSSLPNLPKRQVSIPNRAYARQNTIILDFDNSSSSKPFYSNASPWKDQIDKDKIISDLPSNKSGSATAKLEMRSESLVKSPVSSATRGRTAPTNINCDS